MTLETLEKANELKEEIDFFESYLQVAEKFKDDIIEMSQYKSNLNATADIALNNTSLNFVHMIIRYELLLKVADANIEDFKKQISDLKEALAAL